MFLLELFECMFCGVLQGTKGLSLFYLEVRDAKGQLNGIEVQRLKDKLGTRQLPTAEMLLDGVKALRVREVIKLLHSTLNTFCRPARNHTQCYSSIYVLLL